MDRYIWIDVYVYLTCISIFIHDFPATLVRLHMPSCDRIPTLFYFRALQVPREYVMVLTTATTTAGRLSGRTRARLRRPTLTGRSYLRRALAYPT